MLTRHTHMGKWLTLAGALLLGAGWTIAGWRQKERDPARDREIASQSDALTRELRKAQQREAELRRELERVREEAAQRPFAGHDADAGWLCERLRCYDLQRPPTPDSHEPPLIRDVPPSYGHARP